MRVIAGKARRLPLKTIEGFDTRPTTDRTKETLFNMIQNDIYGISFLDLFSGSGAIGIEALSRGASRAYFVENNKKAVACIRDNLNFTGLSNDAVVMPISVTEAIVTLGKDKILFDIVFMDPPYNHDYEKSTLVQLKESGIISDNTLIIIEASLETDFSYLTSIGFDCIKEKCYKTNKHVFIKMSGE